MRRSFGPGMGSGGGGGRGGGGMIKTVHRTVRAGLGGGASQEPYSHSATTTTRTTNNRNQPINTTLSLSSNANLSSPCSYLNHHVPAPTNWVFSSSPITDDEFDWEYIHGGGSDDGESLNRVLYDDFVLGSVPSKNEVHHAVSSLQEVLDPIIENRRTYGTYDDGIEKISGPTVFHKSGSELDWIEPSLQLHDSTSALHDPRSTRVYDAFHLLQTDPSVQRMVISLSSDKAVWDAVMNNEVVRELRESVNEGKSISECSEDSVDESNPVIQVLRWIFVNTKEKMIEIVEKITQIVNELVRPTGKDEKWKKDADIGLNSFEEKLRSSFLLSIIVLLIVVVSRGRKS
ncbi:uncharacterized protein LOC111904085 [Lactuca sativa]|uniref:Uncharacterized protein n=1 Tax=Lactuca sativa TaxID=4236 RepID=A0A9R1US35_LACSA|nr:uncharacterized protein LOC111904085 [Lactuca sativa]KAJ0192586.1 hypothetical protein LSAT_V11C800392970 [Lactuca sativa]